MDEAPTGRLAAPAAKVLAAPCVTTAAPKSVSACCQAVLAHFAIGPEDLVFSSSTMFDREELRITDIDTSAEHLSLNFLLPMAFGTGYMTITTIGPASIRMPGMRLSPAIVTASLGQPIGRLTGHRAFDEAYFLKVKFVQEVLDDLGRCTTLLHFDDFADPLRGGKWPTGLTIQ